MRIFLLSLLSLLIALAFAVPAMAAPGDPVVDSVDVTLEITDILEFSVNNAGPLTCLIDAYSKFGDPIPIGDVNYTLYANEDWEVDGIILDGAQNGQTAADWEDATWTLSVNGVTIDEGAGVLVDTGLAGDELPNDVWPVLLTVPWFEHASTPDCTIQLTATLI
jgi:hypothetical protein